MTPARTRPTRDDMVLGVSVAVILLALVVITGWHTHARRAVQLVDGTIAMQYNTALSFLALGVAGIGLATRRRWLQWGGAAAATLMGVAVMLEYATEWSVGIDTLFFVPWDTTLAVHPGRMALTTAISFFLNGSALILLSPRPSTYARFGIVTCVPLSLALTSLFGYAFAITYVLPAWLGSQMPVHTAAGLLIYGMAMMRHAWLYAERGCDGLPRWSAGLGVMMLPVVLVAAGAVFPTQTWSVVLGELVLSLVLVGLTTLAMTKLTHAKVAYKGFGMIAIPLAFLLMFVGLVVHLKQQSEDAQRWSSHSAEVQDVSQMLLTQLGETESAVRGYVLTSDESFVATYEESAASITGTIARLQRAVRDNSLQRSRADRIGQLTQRRVAHLYDLVRWVRTGEQARAERSIQTRAGATLMEHVHVALQTFTQEEGRLSAERNDALEASWQRLSWLLVAGAAAAILLASLLSLSFTGGITRRLQHVRDNASRLAAGQPLAAPLTGHDEIAELDRVFRDMAGSLETARRREHQIRILESQRIDVEHAEALHEVRALQRAIFDSARFSCIATDATGTVQIFNVGAERMLGYAAADVVGLMTPAAFHDQNELVERAADVSLEFAAPVAPDFEVLVYKASRGLEDIYEWTNVRKDGSRFPALVSVTALRDAHENIIGYLLSGTDNTARHQIDEERTKFARTLQRQNHELEAASRMKSEFLANMSHELRTPLNAIIGFSEVLRDGLLGELSETQHDFVGNIYGSGSHLLLLINDILDLSKVEAGKMTLELESVPVAALFANSFSVIKVKAAAEGLSMAMDIPDDLGWVEADVRKVTQIVNNLLANAVKFTAQGGRVTLHVSRALRADVGRLADRWTGRSFALADSTCEDFLKIAVTDTGMGISADGMERLFAPFSQVDTGLARKFEGTGLGLVMVKLLAELHGGTIAVESAVGEGSRFTVWLPLRATHDRSVSRVILPEVVGREARAGAPIALMVEDDDKAAHLIRRQLEAEGFAVLHATSAETALLALQRPVSLITLDMMLPRMDGWAFLDQLKQVEGLRRIPVVIMSIMADRHKGFSLGAAAVLEKPVSRQALRESLGDLGLSVSAGHRPKVLIVDDDPNAVELVAVQIADFAGTVLRAYGGREAIAAAQQHRPDVIVLDLMMPDVNGFDVVEALKLDLSTARIPVLVVTAKVITDEDRTQLKGYVETIMEKTEFDRDRLTAEVRRAMSGREVVV